ncbi:hypothetical protein PO909_027733 [Leuciscus waleckii]
MTMTSTDHAMPANPTSHGLWKALFWEFSTASVSVRTVSFKLAVKCFSPDPPELA